MKLKEKTMIVLLKTNKNRNKNAFLTCQGPKCNARNIRIRHNLILHYISTSLALLLCTLLMMISLVSPEQHVKCILLILGFLKNLSIHWNHGVGSHDELWRSLKEIHTNKKTVGTTSNSDQKWGYSEFNFKELTCIKNKQGEYKNSNHWGAGGGGGGGGCVVGGRGVLK